MLLVQSVCTTESPFQAFKPSLAKWSPLMVSGYSLQYREFGFTEAENDFRLGSHL